MVTENEPLPIWKLAFTMMAMAMYLGTSLVFIVPHGIVVLRQTPKDNE